ncbi:NAD(P)/FAD-dependent oxidoreductase [Sulfurovum sp. NBC37-1]|uniref:NAD(P)/FAD-dependent oxidoreductase n=1 Tax=Sulfurovum sp. (strain NBC37-1) TaxID=387093 RepID=UPI0005A01EF3|nr:aminoacetone oxidase family FAD-binding enzyme [Sulfurovum sp. NBC37-1]
MNIIIIGGGASALMLASLLPKKSATIIEKNAASGAKILISGGGKCNITNAVMGTDFFLADKSFVIPSLEAFDEKELLGWLKKRGLEPVLKKDSQYFCKESSRELLSLLQKESRKQTFLYNETVLSVSKREGHFYVKTNKRTLTADAVVVASGGLSFPKLGASGIGYEVAKHFGHSIVRTAPALVGFTVQKEQFFFKELSGTSTEVVINVNGQTCEGSLLFAHKGVSGPAVLDASLYWEKGKMEIDFLPGFSWESIRKSPKQLSSLLPMPKRVTKAFLLQLELHDKTGSKITDNELLILKGLNHYIFAPAGTFGYSKAEVTKGGVDTAEVDRQTMMSKKTEGLFFTGEVLDVTGRLGGYNFQWAFSSAANCARFFTGRKR